MSPWPLVLVLAACASLQRPPVNPRPVATLEQLRADPKGVCASVVNLTAEQWSEKKRDKKTTVGDKLLSSSVQACARIRPGGGGPGEGAVVDVGFIFPQQDEHWRPEFWHVEVVRSSGVVVQAANLDAGKIEDGICVLGACNKEGYASLALPEPWDTDTYRIRLVHVPTRLRVELVISLN